MATQDIQTTSNMDNQQSTSKERTFSPLTMEIWERAEEASEKRMDEFWERIFKERGIQK